MDSRGLTPERIPIQKASVMDVIGWLFFVAGALLLLPNLISIPFKQLKRFEPLIDSQREWPMLSVVFAARNEAEKIREAARSMLAASYPRIEVIAINDRSDDATGDLVEELAATDARLHVVHVAELPDGWLGKNNALQTGANQATGDWILFTDADVHFSPESLRLTVAYAETRKLDHLCVLPNLLGGSFLERAITGAFGMLFVLGCPPFLVPTRLKWIYTGAGAFNLVKRSAYESIGGHSSIRFDVLDDLKLGRQLKQAGFRQDLLFAREELAVRWQDSVWGIVTGLEKNAFAAADYSFLKLTFATSAVLIAIVLPAVLAIVMPSTGAVACAILWHAAFGAFSFAFGTSILATPFLVPGMLLMVFAAWRSAFLTVWRGGVVWRGTLYPLEELRRSLASQTD